MATAFADPVMPFPGFDRASDDNILVNPQATADESVHAVYTRLREQDPVHWCAPTGYRPFWAITRHADITTVSKANSRFINSRVPISPPPTPKNGPSIRPATRTCSAPSSISTIRCT